jgi:hypothetical protein
MSFKLSMARPLHWRGAGAKRRVHDAPALAAAGLRRQIGAMTADRIERLGDRLATERILGLGRLARRMSAKTWPAAVIIAAWLLWPQLRPWLVSLLAGVAAAIGAAAWLRAALLAEFNLRVAIANEQVRRHNYQDYAPPLTATGTVAWDELGD